MWRLNKYFRDDRKCQWWSEKYRYQNHWVVALSIIPEISVCHQHQRRNCALSIIPGISVCVSPILSWHYALVEIKWKKLWEEQFREGSPSPDMPLNLLNYLLWHMHRFLSSRTETWAHNTITYLLDNHIGIKYPDTLLHKCGTEQLCNIQLNIMIYWTEIDWCYG